MVHNCWTSSLRRVTTASQEPQSGVACLDDVEVGCGCAASQWLDAHNMACHI